MDVKQVRPSHSESYERLFHNANPGLRFDETTAVTPLPIQQKAGMPETYPFGL